MISRALAALVLLASTAHGDELATSPLRPGYQPHDHVLHWHGRGRLERRGLELDVIYAFEVFAAPQLDKRAVVTGLFVAELDLDLAALLDRRLGAFHVTWLGIHGSGLTAELMDVHGTSSNVAPQDFRLYEAWLEQPFGRFTVRAGVLAVDQEFMIADQAQTLLGGTFGTPTVFAYRVMNPTYPVGALGASARLELDAATLRAAVYDGTQPNTRGVPTGLGPDVLAFAEATLGIFQIGGWHHSVHGNGFYVAADGKLDAHVGAFARVAASPDGGVRSYLDAGIRIGPGPWRADDLISAGIAFAHTEQGAETLVEGTYVAQLRWLTVQPAVQAVLLRDRTVGVLATRMTVVF